MNGDFLNSSAKVKIIMNYGLRIVNYFCLIKTILQLLDLQILKNVRRLR